VDVLIASERFAEPLVGTGAPPEEALEALYQLGPKDVIITLGSRGSIGKYGEETHVVGVRMPKSLRKTLLERMDQKTIPSYVVGVLQENIPEIDPDTEQLLRIVKGLNASLMSLGPFRDALVAAQTAMKAELEKPDIRRFQELIG